MRSPSAPNTAGSIASGAGATTRTGGTHGARRSQTLGLSAGERVAIMGDACEEWMICDLAAQSLGAIVYGIYPTASIAEVEYQMRDGGASIFIAGDQEYVDKILPLADGRPGVCAPSSQSTTRRCSAMTTASSGACPDLLGAAEPDLDWLKTRVARLKPTDPAFIVYTSGTTGASERRAGQPRHPSRGDRDGGRPLSDAAREDPPHGRSFCRSATCSAATSPSRCR